MLKKHTVGLGIICKDEVEQIDRILAKYSQFFDKVHITITNPSKRKELEKVIKSHGAECSYFDWIDDFSAARNFNKAQLNTTYIFRMDADDEIENPQEIQGILDNAAANDLNIIYCYYVYSRDDHGVCNAAHWRETMYKNDNNLFWNKKIHENILVRNTTGHRIDLNEKVRIVHKVDADHALQSALRNIKYLLKEYNQDGDKTDSRTLAYLGRMFMGVGDFERAIIFLKKHIETSGWDEDRYYSWCCLAEICKQRGEYDVAIGAAMEALQERPDYPDAYLRLHDIYFDMKDWKKALIWGKRGLEIPLPKTFMLIDPSSYTWRPVLSLAFTYFQLSDFETAMKLLMVAKKEVPDLDWIKDNEKLFVEALDNKRFVEHFMWLYRYLDSKKHPKMLNLFEVIPDGLRECDLLFGLKNKYKEPKKWADDSVIIFCGMSAEPWSPKMVETGIGGSEEAVIHMANSLARIGWKVTVFCNCLGQEGKYGDVDYRHYTDFHPRDEHNILIGWRNNIFTFDIKAKKKIVWLHDLPSNIDLSKNGIGCFDRIVVLSEYHKKMLISALDPMPLEEFKKFEEKIFVSTNGINAEDFKDLVTNKKPHRVIYASSYNRGLETILKIWPEVRKQLPDAELHCYYGWQVYDEFVRAGLIKEDGWKNKMVELMKQDGVKEHGRIGHKELLKEYCKAAVFAYPCTYAGEINCIALTKAIACGCYPVTNDYAVMKERNQFGSVADDEEGFKTLLIDALKKSYNDPINHDYIEANSWDSVAREWHKELLK
jgi:tetratricopeptide (TPR) repeat protein/glycosyltransferase involved in cell wall biosynthesis